MKKIFFTFLWLFIAFQSGYAQEYFTIKQYDVSVKVNENSSLDVTETINVEFSEPRHGIFRTIPFKYPLVQLSPGTEKANRQLESGGYTRIIIEDISVDGRNFDVNTEGDYKVIKIGSADKYVDGSQQYKIHYRVLNAINFFKDHSEFYFNLIGDRWPVNIESVNFSVELYKSLSETPVYFVATGTTGSTDNYTNNAWSENRILTGTTTEALGYGKGLTIGINLPAGFLIEQNYFIRGISWLILPFLVFAGMFFIWRKWGKDDKPTIRTEFYPPENCSPAIAGYLIDDILNRRDLTALVPYWGGEGYLQVKEIEESSFLGLIKKKDYEFIKLKDLPENAFSFEKKLFCGIFRTGDKVLLSDLKDKLYTSMNDAKSALENEIDRSRYYTMYSKTRVVLYSILGIILMIIGIGYFFSDNPPVIWFNIAMIASGIITLIFGIFMGKKSRKGTELYQKLAGFKEFIKSVEKDRLEYFLKQDEHYFDKVLPYAIVFNVADAWKDKLKDLDIPPPNWYVGNYTAFNTLVFMNSLDHSLNEMSSSFYSQPSSSGTSGGSFGGGGFSGGGFGGGGGGSW